ncbi:Haem-binding domain-containing protein [Hydrobacter penzbergensis]|uniref:Haem-binding domain-containing protein n=1 Tax=Hydrobacter penzbergensis TaxID=1235997 RepID=A0A8X8IET3_9BACT|nr:heme-binding domain-containing protein [Hydrobacter penzbergensis]SDW51499.1 Haem-binding domain-containing protein [Hydrobacter penzbergensis]
MNFILKTIWKRIVLFAVIAFALIQFIPKPKRNSDDTISEASFNTVYVVPDTIMHVLKTACYDCHSNNTRYPWYSNIQPVAWYLNRHIVNGKEELNFDEFGRYSRRRQQSKFKAIASQIEDNEMPLSSYRLLHREARLTKDEKRLLITWAKSSLDNIDSKK